MTTVKQIKTIRYIPKVTGARTEYREIDVQDMAYIQQELIRWMTLIGELDMARDQEIKSIRTALHERNANLPKGRLGQNSITSFISGMISNLVFGGQRDLTSIQMTALETIAAIMSTVFSDCEAYRFQIGLGE
jgi:hypothetical protein